MLLMVSASGCGALAGESAEPDGLVSLYREGGLKGEWDRVTVYDDGELRTEHEDAGSTEGRLTGQEMNHLRALLRKVGFADLPPRSVSNVGGDRYVYRLTHREHTIVTDQTRKFGAADEVIDLLSPQLAGHR
ncbi:hypothetical protein [Streptomyces buecherae]|uniref:hypothetical protein n=1 Tax=Streptomyces buecherae TaxID=2763006 RepID=UPI003678D547